MVSWPSSFATMLPRIERQLKRDFQGLDSEAKEEAIQEAIVHARVTYSRLEERGKAHVVRVTSLANYAALMVKRGRPAVGCMNCREPLSRYGQFSGNGIEREPWIDELIADKRAAVCDVVVTRLDFRAWFATLPQRLRAVAKRLAIGCTTSEVAHHFGVSAGRISQIRRELETSWRAFQHDV